VLPRLNDQVVVVGGGSTGTGAAVTRALVQAGARIVVPVPTETAAERFYLEMDPESVPRLRTAIGASGEPGTLSRIAAVARREFGGIDHLVAAFPAPADGALWALDADTAHAAMHDGAMAPGLFALGLQRHLAGGVASVHRIVVLAATDAPGARVGAPALGRTFATGLVTLLRSASRPGTEAFVLSYPQAGEGGDAVAGRAAAWLLAEGAAQAAVDAHAVDR
jgi:NAD(P)-dependent dehydrogenase (short-subunit alcohol dehydrogenase family)